MTEVKKRGRPVKIKPRPSPLFTYGFDCSDVIKISTAIKCEVGSDLKISDAMFTDLAHIGIAHSPLTELRSTARMKAGCTKRPSIHETILLRDVATVYAKHMNSCARKELKKINGYREERRVGKNYIQTPVEIYARAIFKSIGRLHPQTFRRLAKEALQYV